MPTNFGGRIAIILFVLIGSLLAIVSPGRLFNASIPWSQKTNLKPGIDIAGGTSLIYEIKGGETRSGGQTLAEQVAAALKKRVDPNGVQNLVWRPQGETRLEIQIPRAANAEKRDKAQKALTTAQDELKKTNINYEEVKRAIEKMTGPERDKRLEELSGGSKDRLETFQSLAKSFDDIQHAKAAGDEASKTNNTAKMQEAALAESTAQGKYDDGLAKIESGNISQEELNTILDLPPSTRAQRLDELKAKFKDFPARLTAIDHYISAYDTFIQFKGSLDSAEALKRMLRGSGVLEFHILVTDMQSAETRAMIDRLHTKGPAPTAGDTMRWYLVDNPAEFKGNTQKISAEDKREYALAYITLDKQMVHKRDANPWSLERAFPEMDPQGGRAVGFMFDAQGAKFFSELTRNNVGNFLAIVLDDRMISAPRLNSEIGARGIITGGGAGGFAPNEIKYLVNTLSAGSLPATLADEPVSERTVSPQLGVDNLYRGLIASGIGLVVVAVFLIGYYYLAGLVAFFAVVMNLVIILGVLAMLGATFTMPSIAGIVLTVGTAVDANVLVFERMREEEHRGFPLKLALQHAYDRAFSAILDSNMTTAITSAFLYLLGSEEVKGFGLTLLIGIISSLFTALFVTKTIFAILIDKYDLKELGSIPTSFPKWDKALKPNIDWMGMIWPFITFSTIFIIAGLSAFAVKKRELFDIEFASGTSVQFELTHNMKIEDVRARVNSRSHEIPSASVVSLNNREDFYEVVTPNDKATQVRDAVLEALGPDLKLERPSKFDMAQQSGQINVDPAMNTVVLPIEKEEFEAEGKRIQEAAGYVGGTAIVLRNLEPPISPNEIRGRIDRAALQPGLETNLSKWHIEVVRLDNDASKDAGNHVAKTAVVLAQNPDFLYAKNPVDWKENTAGRMWKLVNEGVNREAKLQKVSNFDPQVAGDTQRDAFLATLCSIIVIMIYIWFRFGDMKYATATVVALIHDTLIVVGAVGLSHYLDNGFGHLLLVEPFRINLTLVAAILTIMGYSMIDTIVVFDRIRENRGRYGQITRKVINDSINQTLSRTLLTAGTTIIMVAVMYICGGAGIHGFTFVLLVGILVGTYSSIAIAAPILLIGAKGEQTPTPPDEGGVSRRLGGGQSPRGAGRIEPVSVNRRATNT
jgi:SecD/SecF fusion protein